MVFSNSFTRRAEDWVLYYSLEGLKYQQARKIETHVKLMRNRKYYENLKNYPEIAEKLKLRFNNEKEEEQ
jgi:putative endonuclease